MATFENGKNYSVPFKISNNGPILAIFDLIRNEKQHSHSTTENGSKYYRNVRIMIMQNYMHI